MKTRARCRRREQSGVAVLEFSMILLVLLPLLVGTSGYGINMLRSMEVIQLARDAGHMFARGADFAQPGNKTILATLGSSIGMKTSGTTSNAVVILSSLVFIDKAMCAADGKVDGNGNPAGCTNYGKWVFTRRIVIGDSTMRTSNLGSPLQSGSTPLADPSTGKVSVHDQVTNSGDVAVFTGINPYSSVNGDVSGLPSGQSLYVAEAAAEGIKMPPIVNNATVYSFNVF